jgi:hypothetical protein
VNAEGKVVQELQVSPMGVIELIYPLDDKTDNGLGLDIFAQVRNIMGCCLLSSAGGIDGGGSSSSSNEDGC